MKLLETCTQTPAPYQSLVVCAIWVKDACNASLQDDACNASLQDDAFPVAAHCMGLEFDPFGSLCKDFY